MLLRNRSPFSALRFLSIALLMIAIVLSALQLVRYSRVRAYFPAGLRIAGIPVGGLDRQQAAQRVLEYYSLPVELHYGNSVIQMPPSAAEFTLDLDSMLAAADLQRTQTSFWEGFWDHLWGRSPAVGDVPLRAGFSEPRLKQYLQEVAERYDQAPVPALPVVGTVNFQPGKPGTTLDVDNSILLIESALRSLTNRTVMLPLGRATPPRPSFKNLEVLLHQTLDVSGFDGLAGVYLLDLQNGQEIHFAYQNGQDIPVQPDIAFTASSIIKVPIMVSSYARIDGAADTETSRLMGEMIEYSGNETADWLMDRVIDDRKGPLVVTEDMKKLGLENTFLAGYFTIGSPLLASVQTPANQRLDVDTDPDPYSQTTPSDIGTLLGDIYTCAQDGGGALEAVFPGQITQAECQAMVRHLVNNKLPTLITAGVPDGTQVAHKHGWVSDPNGVIDTIGDAAIVYTPGGNYVFVVFLNHPVQLLWEPSTQLVMELSRAVWNYYNVPQG